MIWYTVAEELQDDRWQANTSCYHIAPFLRSSFAIGNWEGGSRPASGCGEVPHRISQCVAKLGYYINRFWA